MNDQARAWLIAAELSGHPKQRKVMHGTVGDCALGVIHLGIHKGNRSAALKCVSLRNGWMPTCLAGYVDVSFRTPYLCSECGSSYSEATYIAHLFDVHELDYLTIARKL